MNPKQLKFILTVVLPVGLAVAGACVYFNLSSAISLTITIFLVAIFGSWLRNIK